MRLTISLKIMNQKIKFCLLHIYYIKLILFDNLYIRIILIIMNISFNRFFYFYEYSKKEPILQFNEQIYYLKSLKIKNISNYLPHFKIFILKSNYFMPN